MTPALVEIVAWARQYREQSGEMSCIERILTQVGLSLEMVRKWNVRDQEGDYKVIEVLAHGGTRYELHRSNQGKWRIAFKKVAY